MISHRACGGLEHPPDPAPIPMLRLRGWGQGLEGVPSHWILERGAFRWNRRAGLVRVTEGGQCGGQGRDAVEPVKSGAYIVMNIPSERREAEEAFGIPLVAYRIPCT